MQRMPGGLPVQRPPTVAVPDSTGLNVTQQPRQSWSLTRGAASGIGDARGRGWYTIIKTRLATTMQSGDYKFCRAGPTAEVLTTPPRRGAALGVRRTRRAIGIGNARARLSA